MRRPVWPLWGIPTGILGAVVIGLFMAGVWVDERFAWTAAVLLLPLLAGAGVTAINLDEGNTYIRKTRAMRKAERAAEERAYIKKLERDLGL